MRIALLLLAVVAGLLPATADEPAPTTPAPDETVWLFPTIGALAPEGQVWHIPVQIWLCEEELDSPLRAATLTGMVVSLRLDEATARSHLFRRRARWFIVDNERGKALQVRLGGHLHTLPETDAAGHSRTILPLPVQDGDRLWRAGDRVPLEVVFAAGDERVVKTEVLLAPTLGLSVISDLDDTLKISEVTDHQKLLRRTFTEPFEPVPGMVERLAAWQREGALFHYVTASPWQLYPELSAFFAATGFPAGTWHMKQVRLKDRTLAALWEEPDVTKRAAILPLLAAHPERQFILLGDAGERDPEIYGELARAYPAQIRHIYIRLLPGRDEEPLRWATAFAGLPADRWTLLP